MSPSDNIIYIYIRLYTLRLMCIMYISSEYVYSLFVILNETHRGVQMACCVFVRFFFMKNLLAGMNDG